MVIHDRNAVLNNPCCLLHSYVEQVAGIPAEGVEGSAFYWRREAVFLVAGATAVPSLAPFPVALPTQQQSGSPCCAAAAKLFERGMLCPA